MLPTLVLLLVACGEAPAPPTAPEPPAGHDPAPPAAHHGGGMHPPEGAHERPHHGGDHATVQHGFDDVDKWVKVFDDPERDAWQKPAELVAALDIPPGSAVADVGAGTGYFNPHLARAVGAEGTVVAVDIEPNLVAYMTERAGKEGTPQVKPRLGAPDDPGLQPGEVDLVLLVDTYHHIDGRVAWFTRLKEAVKPGGRLAVVDFKPGELPVGPPEGHRIPVDKVVAELTEAGWAEVSRPDVLPYQFVVVMRRD
jgi:ubiquinone/menaquinone biosynthesis C-methylase UbiE